MRARVAAAGLVLLAALAGCTATEPQESATATATPTSSASPASDLDCDALLPASRASSALGQAEDRLEGSRDEAVRGSSELIREAAQENGGLLTCSWFEQEGPASVTASAAEEAAGAFEAAGFSGDRLAPDAEAYGSCTDGRCDVDLLAGTTWVTLELVGAPEDVDLAGLATATAADVSGALEEPVPATAPVCADVLTTEELTTTAGLAQPTPGSGTEGTVPASAPAEAAARAGYASCSWVDASSSSFSGLSIDVLPNGEEGWRTLSLTSGLSIPLEPLDGIGDRALSGCGGGSCEIDVVADGTWWRIVVSGDAARADAVARAVLTRAAA